MIIVRTVLLIVLSFCTQTLVIAQTKEEDQARFTETIKWLTDKLTYDYFNPETNEYWSNRFFHNAKDGTFSVRNIATDTPKQSNKNMVLDRTVLIHLLDAASITVSNSDENEGRMVKGKVITVNTIGKEREIQKTFNSVTSVKEYNLKFSIPQYYLDSADYLPNEIQEKLSLAISLASKVYSATAMDDNVKTMLATFSGTFQGSNGTTRQYNNILHSAVESDETTGTNVVRKEFMGYNSADSTFFKWVIQEHGSQTTTLKLLPHDHITLYSEVEKYKLTIEGYHDFTVEENGTIVTYHRIGFH